MDVQIMRMEMARLEAPEGLQSKWDAIQIGDWVNYLARWQVISHLTFSWESSLDSARRCYEKFMARKLPRASYFYALEENPSRDGYHVHALWADVGQVFRKELWADWFKHYGRGRIEPVNSQKDVSNYCAKYCTKRPAWWNVKLQWHRVQHMHNATFQLRDGNEQLGCGLVPLKGSCTTVSPQVDEGGQASQDPSPSVSAAWVRQSGF